MYRHGDVNLFAVSAEDYAVTKGRGTLVAHHGSHVLMRGEATGSLHLLTVDQDQLDLVQDGDALWLHLTAPGSLTHTHDHDTLTILPGYYVQVPERECDHFMDSVVRRVVD